MTWTWWMTLAVILAVLLLIGCIAVLLPFVGPLMWFAIEGRRTAPA